MPTFDPKKFLQTLTSEPGVYQMLDDKHRVLYVGKAKNLKKRVASYFAGRLLDTKTLSLVKQICDIQIIVTRNENEALLLENNLIKELHPRYNILYRDDKSYPYLYLSDYEEFPALNFYRGSRRHKGKYFGPYPSASSVRETLTLLQKLFQIRQCSDGFFKSRTRPCLQYFIKRCTAPCVGYVDTQNYHQQVDHAVLFLQGKSNQIVETLAKQMEQASEALNFEVAAHLRDQIVALRRVQEHQYVMGDEGDADVIVAMERAKYICIEMLYIRAGRLIGSKAYFPKVPEGTTLEESLGAFLPQYYLDSTHSESIPERIILNFKLAEQEWLQAALSEQYKKKIIFVSQPRGKTRQWLQIALTNAKQALNRHVVDKANYYHRFEILQQVLKLANLPQLIECFDVSHTMGEATVASCVVFTMEGPEKKNYRRFNIEGVTKGDDYGALKQAITRRYTRLKTEEQQLPDLLMIDGGKGQLKIAEDVLEELQVTGVTLLAIAKGLGRKPGLETLFLSGNGKEGLHLPPDSLALHLLQQIRDEAHRFAITGHRQRRAKARSKSTLEDIPGIGPKKRRELLNYFGGLQEIKRASVEQLAAVPGMSKALAQKVYDAVH